MKTILERVLTPRDLKKLNMAELRALSREIRSYLIKTVASNGGHLAPNLGVVELTLALHYVLDLPGDKVIWDVGHQSYIHKLLTGRRDLFPTLRQYGGLSGFPKPQESEYDAYGTGHSSTSISAALGLAQARFLKREDHQVVAVIGDGALTGGLAYEALNHAGHLNLNMVVVLNDNKMSIDQNIGGMSAYLGRIRSDPKYTWLKDEVDQFMRRIPAIGETVSKSAERLKSALKYSIVPGALFEELGFTYLGPVDGHNLSSLIPILRSACKMKGPVLVHVMTQKGKGYSYAEEKPSYFHGVGPFNLSNGLPQALRKTPTYTQVFGQTLLKLAENDPRVLGITAAMAGGTGLDLFAEKYPHRFFDVGIAEQHAITMAGGLAAGGFRPVVAVYSTFLQRAYDQVLHDLCIQKLPVVLALDRAGIVGEDGETHQGLFDLSFLRHIPNLSLMAPRDENELQHMLSTALAYDGGPVAIRYPRAVGEGVTMEEPRVLPWGKSEVMREGEDLLILSAGTMVYPSLKAAEKLFWQGIKAAVVNIRFVKPLDEELILGLAAKCKCILTVEENVLAGGFGSGVLELMEQKGMGASVKRLGVSDSFVPHGARKKLLNICKLDEEGIFNEALNFCRRQMAGKRR